MKSKIIVLLFLALIVFGITGSQVFAITNSDAADLETHKHSIVYVKNVFEINGIIKANNGTGFFIDSNHVMTVYHAIHNEKEATTKYIRLYFQEAYYRTSVDATVVYVDPTNDIAILKVVDSELSFIMDKVEPLKLFANEMPNSNDALTIIGFPHDTVKETENNSAIISIATSESTYSVSRGNLRGKVGEQMQTTSKVVDEQMLATNKIRGGYSGSPVLNENGHVVGLERAKTETNEAVFVPLDVLIKDIKEFK